MASAFESGLRFDQLKGIVTADAFKSIERSKGSIRNNRGYFQVVLSYQTADTSSKTGKRQIRLTHQTDVPFQKGISDTRKRIIINRWKKLVLADAEKVRGASINPTQTVRALCKRFIDELEKLGELTAINPESRETRQRNRVGISHTTATKRRGDVKRLEGQLIYDMPLASVTHEQLQECVIAMCERYSGETVRATFTMLRMVFAWALGKKVDNPCDGLALPSIGYHPAGSKKAAYAHGLNILTEKQTRDFISRCIDGIGTRSEKICIGALIAVTCGLRTEEICGLRWSDVHLNAEIPYIHVGRAAVRYQHDGKWVYEIAPTKTQKSVRDVPLFPQTADALRMVKAHVTEVMFATEYEGGNRPAITSLYVLGDLDGNFRHANTLSHGFMQYAKRHGIVGDADRPVTMHALRDTYASRLKDRGVSTVAISKLLGHSNIATTESRYLDADKDALNTAILDNADLFMTRVPESDVLQLRPTGTTD